MLRRKNIQMNVDDFETYYIPAAIAVLNLIYGDMDDISSKSVRGSLAVATFDKLLGVTICQDYVRRATGEDRPIPEDWRQFMTALAGPYTLAVLRAYQIKYGVDHVIEKK